MRALLVQILLALGLASASACTASSFNVSLTGQTTIDGDPATAGAPLTGIPAIGSFVSIDLGASEEFIHYGVSKEGVQSLKVAEVRLQIVNPGTQGFDFLDQVSFVASAGNDELLVAEKLGISQRNLDPPNPAFTLDVKESVELRGFLGAPTLSLTARGTGRVPPQDTTLQVSVRLKVELKVF